MDQSFGEMMAASRNNDYSWLLPTVFVFGSIALLLLAWIKNAVVRRVFKVGIFITSLFLAIAAAAMEISEKWRIRDEWVEANKEHIADSQMNILIVDGANLALGPIIIGAGYGTLIFGSALAVSSLLVRGLNRGKRIYVNHGDSADNGDTQEETA